MMSRKYYPMKSDVRESQDAYLLEVDLPGCQREDIKAYIEDGYLNIEASLNKEKKKGKGNFIRRECFSGDYKRSFYVGTEVETEDLSAKYKHGVLSVSIPKEVKPKEKKSNEIKIA